MRINKIDMDGFTGAILAVESFRDARAVLHGPGGCREYHAACSKQYYPRLNPQDMKKYLGDYYYGQYRVPCTFIDETDYINGCTEKIKGSIPEICDLEDDVTVVYIKSPGAALIGDNITDLIAEQGYSNRAMAVEESLISAPFSSSYDHTIKTMLEWMDPEKNEVKKDSVNILGLPISFNDWSDSLREFSDYLKEMGLTIVSTPGAGCSMSELKDSVNAEYNVVVSSEYCRRTMELYRDKYGIAPIVGDSGAPVGFTALKEWILKIASITGKDPTNALSKIKETRRRVYDRLRGSMFTQRAKCTSYAIVADSSILYPLTQWLYQYLGMIPVALIPSPGSDPAYIDKLSQFLNDNGLMDAMGDNFKGCPDFVLADGHTAGMMQSMGECSKGIDIDAPSISRINFRPTTPLGIQGALYLLDQIYSAL